MEDDRTVKTFIKSLPTATSPDARWGLMGIVVGFILFAIPLAIYFFDKGGVLMWPPCVWITLGIIVMIVWVITAICCGLTFWRWWKTPKTEKPISAAQLQALIEVNWQLKKEMRRDRNERRRKKS